MNTVRVGFAGLGGIASRFHLPALHRLQGVEILAGAEINPEQAERTKQRFGIPKVYSSYHEMIEKELLEAIYVCLPNALHYDATAIALEKGLHVYCEKPMGLSSEQAAGLVNEAERRGLILMPGYNFRFQPSFSNARQIIKEKRLGNILQIHGIAANAGPYIGWDPKSDWYFDPRNGGVLYDWGSHLLDLLFYISDIEIEEVCATAQSSLPGLPAPDNIIVVFRGSRNVVGSLSLSWAAPGKVTMLQFHGTAGTILVSEEYFEHRTPQHGGLNKLITLLDNMKSLIGQKVRSSIPGKTYTNSYIESARNFIEAIRTQAPLRVNPWDSVRVHHVLEAIRQSLEKDRNNTWQRVSPMERPRAN